MSFIFLVVIIVITLHIHDTFSSLLEESTAQVANSFPDSLNTLARNS
jgi:hypothetical protein